MGLVVKSKCLRFTYSENISSTFWTCAFYCWSAIF